MLNKFQTVDTPVDPHPLKSTIEMGHDQRAIWFGVSSDYGGSVAWRS